MNRIANFKIDKYSKWGYIKYFLAQFTFIIAPIILYFIIDIGKGILIYIAIFLLLFLKSFFNKIKFEVYAIKFDDERKVVIIYQFKYLFRSEIKIKYTDYSSDFKTMSFGLGNLMKALVIKDKDKIVAMIGKKSWFNWKDEELNNINNFISANVNIMK
jgi:hypothetical protein